MLLKNIFLHFLLIIVSHQTLLNINRLNISSSLSMYYSFTDNNTIQFTFAMTKNTGWLAMGFGSNQTKIDLIRVYMDGGTAKADDLYSSSDFVYSLDTALGGTADVNLVSGTRVNGFLNITVSRPLNTNDIYDFTIVNNTTIKTLFLIATVDDITTKYVTQILANSYLTSTQICHTKCQLGCSGPEITDCTCPAGYYFITSNSSCGACISNCSHCSDSSSCITCFANYFLQTNPLQCTLCQDGNQFLDQSIGTCTICDTNCEQCSSDIACLTCLSGYRLDSSQLCRACIANCSECTTDTDCKICKAEFYFNSISKKCESCSKNCKVCTNQTTCTQCLNNFYFSGADCVACNSSGQLQQGINDGSGTCENCVSNCLSCSEKTKCTQCLDGYLNSGDSSTCNKCTVNNCKICNPVSECTNCLDGFNLISNTCQKCSISNCLTCDSTSQECVKCNSTYSLFKGKCTFCNMSNCAYCNENNSKICVYCADGYYLQENGLCAQGTVSNCLVPWGETSCVSCASNFDLYQNNSCLQCSVSNCKSCSSNNICDKCNSQYLLQNNLCSKCIANCDSCSDLKTCSSCSTGYYLNSEKTCSNCSVSQCGICSTDPTSCDQCLISYALSSDKKKCSSCSDLNCSTCSSAATCIVCKTGFYLDSNVCKVCPQENCESCSSNIKCDTCLTGYSPNSDQTSCSYCPFETCRRCDKDYQCNNCKPEYFFNSTSNSCISCKSNCVNCNNFANCSECTTSYYLFNNDCVACTSNCAQCNQTSCISCLSGFGLNSSGQCITCNVANCLACSSNNICSQCNADFSLNSITNSCGCSDSQIWDSASKQCKSCGLLYNNCHSCTNATCLTCLPGFFQPINNSGTCTKCNQDTNCGVCNTTHCLSCISGFYLLPNNTCANCFIDCSNCTGTANNQCSACITGFSLSLSKNQCSTSKCPSSFSNCKSCVRNNNGNLVCATCNDKYFLNADTSLCDFCHPNCLSCSGKSASNCLSCPSYSLYYKETGTCVNNCEASCKTCDGLTESDCLSCPDNTVLLDKHCVSNSQALQNISNFSASDTGISSKMKIYAGAIRSFTQRTTSNLIYCSNNNECFNNGECYQSVCLCLTGFKGIQCQISQSDLVIATNKKNEIVKYIITSLSSLKFINSNNNRLLQDSNSTNSTNSSNSSNSNNNSNISNNSNSSATTTTTTTDTNTLAISFDTIVELSIPIELWTDPDSVNSTIVFLNQILRNNGSSLNQTTITSGVQALSNMVYILNNANTTLVNLSRPDQTYLYQNISETIQKILNITLSSLKAVGDAYYIHTPYLNIALNYIDLSQSQSPKYTVYSSQYYDVNDIYMTQVSFTADSTSLITKINGGNSKIILKQSVWIATNPFSENRDVQNNLSLATGISSVDIYKSSGDYLAISGISDAIAVRIKKVVSTNALDTTNTLLRYACVFWDNSSSLWSLDGINNDKTTDSQNYIGCYTNHLTDFTVVWRNKTDFFALEFVETQLSYVRSNYGFIACIILLILSILLVPGIAFTKYEKTGFTKRQKPTVYKDVRELEKNFQTENEEKHEINLNTFQSYDKIDDRKYTDSLNYWMFFPMYAIVFSESPSISVQKYTIFLINLMVYLTILSFCFADFTIPELRDKAVFAGFSFAAILVSWFTNYIYGFWAWSLRKKDNLRVNILYWPIFFIIWIVLAIFISWRMAYVETEYSNYWLLSIAICLVFDMFLFDLFIVVIAKEVGSNPRNLQLLSKFFRLRGFYD